MLPNPSCKSIAHLFGPTPPHKKGNVISAEEASASSSKQKKKKRGTSKARKRLFERRPGPVSCAELGRKSKRSASRSQGRGGLRESAQLKGGTNYPNPFHIEKETLVCA